MIVASANSHTGLITLQIDHQKLALQLARKFGNHLVPELKPKESLEYLCGRIDEGWRDLDYDTPNDPHLGLPCDFRDLPFTNISQTWGKTIKGLVAYHPFCGLIASLLFCKQCKSGLYTWQDKSIAQFIDSETQRQDELRCKLREEFLTEHYADPKLIDIALTQVSFIDELALDLITNKSKFKSYSLAAKEGNQVLAMEKIDQSVYCMSPFPFLGKEIEICVRRFHFPTLKNQSSLNYRNILTELEQVIETIRIVG